MAIKLTKKDHRGLDTLLDAVLTMYAKGEVSLGEARGVLAHVFTAAAIDNENEVNGWLNRPEVLADWKQGMSDGR